MHRSSLSMVAAITALTTVSTSSAPFIKRAAFVGNGAVQNMGRNSILDRIESAKPPNSCLSLDQYNTPRLPNVFQLYASDPNDREPLPSDHSDDPQAKASDQATSDPFDALTPEDLDRLGGDHRDPLLELLKSFLDSLKALGRDNTKINLTSLLDRLDAFLDSLEAFLKSIDSLDRDTLKLVGSDKLNALLESLESLALELSIDDRTLSDHKHRVLIRILNGVLRTTVKPFLALVPLHPDVIELVRSLSEKAFVDLVPENPNLIIEPLEFKACSGEWIQSKESTPEKVILYLPGGAYLSGSSRARRRVTFYLVEKTNAAVLSLDYRKAPQGILMDSVNDAYSAYDYLKSRGFSDEDIIVGGDSAGGHLSMAVLQQLREKGCRLPAGVFLFSPWTDMEMRSKSLIHNRHSEPMIPVDRMKEVVDFIIGELSPDHPIASPVNADMRDYPPLLIHVSKIEALHGDSERLAQRAKEFNVEVVFEEWDEMPHAFQVFGDLLPQGADSLNKTVHFIDDCHHRKAECDDD